MLYVVRPYPAVENWERFDKLEQCCHNCDLRVFVILRQRSVSLRFRSCQSNAVFSVLFILISFNHISDSSNIKIDNLMLICMSFVLNQWIQIHIEVPSLRDYFGPIGVQCSYYVFYFSERCPYDKYFSSIVPPPHHQVLFLYEHVKECCYYLTTMCPWLTISRFREHFAFVYMDSNSGHI